MKSTENLPTCCLTYQTARDERMIHTHSKESRPQQTSTNEPPGRAWEMRNLLSSMNTAEIRFRAEHVASGEQSPVSIQLPGNVKNRKRIYDGHVKLTPIQGLQHPCSFTPERLTPSIRCPVGQAGGVRRASNPAYSRTLPSSTENPGVLHLW